MLSWRYSSSRGNIKSKKRERNHKAGRTFRDYLFQPPPHTNSHWVMPRYGVGPASRSFNVARPEPIPTTLFFLCKIATHIKQVPIRHCFSITSLVDILRVWHPPCQALVWPKTHSQVSSALLLESDVLYTNDGQHHKVQYWWQTDHKCCT